MRIGFDAKRALYNRSGLGNYSRDTIRILAEHYPQHSTFAYSPGPGKEGLFAPPPNCQVRQPSSAFFRTFSSAWRSYGIGSDLDRDAIDLYHGLSNELPLGLSSGKIRKVVTIHDLIFMRHPEYYKPVDRWIYRQKFTHAARNADAVIAVSRYTAKDIIELLSIPENKVQVVYQGYNAIFAQEPSRESLRLTKEKYGLPDSFILTVGTIEQRKNQLSVLKALRESKTDIPVVMVGKATLYKRELDEYIERHAVLGVHFLHQVPTADLPMIYRQAAMVVYPSLIEGFGIPVLEAVACGVPVITSADSCMEEAAGPGALYVNPQDIHEMASALKNLMNDTVLRRKLITEGQEYIRQFTDHAIASNLMNVYTSLF